MSDTPTFSSKNFTCRKLVEGDVDTFWPSFSDEGLMRYWSRGPFTDKSELRDYLLDDSFGRSWVAVPHDGGAPVFRLYASVHSEGVAEIGYIGLPDGGGKGVATEAVSAFVTHLLRTEGFHRIFADTDPRNAPSNRLLERLGFTREAHLRDAMKTHIGWCDSWLWGLLSDEWPQ